MKPILAVALLLLASQSAHSQNYGYVDDECDPIRTEALPELIREMPAHRTDFVQCLMERALHEGLVERFLSGMTEEDMQEYLTGWGASTAAAEVRYFAPDEYSSPVVFNNEEGIRTLSRSTIAQFQEHIKKINKWVRIPDPDIFPTVRNTGIGYEVGCLTRKNLYNERMKALVEAELACRMRYTNPADRLKLIPPE